MVFLIPFSIYWFVVFYFLHSKPEFSDAFASQQGLTAMKHFGGDTTYDLFYNSPPILPLVFLLLMITSPFFAVLACFGQFSGDLNNGFFRFLIARCYRLEIYIARLLSAIILITVAFLVVFLIAIVMSIQHQEHFDPNTFYYSLQVFSVLLIYVLPFTGFMSLLSTLFKSETGCCLFGNG